MVETIEKKYRNIRIFEEDAKKLEKTGGKKDQFCDIIRNLILWRRGEND